MATSTHRLIQDQNLNILCNGTTHAGKTDVAKADKKGGLARRKALNDISNSRKPSVLPSGKKGDSTKVIAIEKDPFGGKAKLSKAPENGKVGGGRKALSDLTNSVRPPSKLLPSTGRKFDAVVEENVPRSVAEERFLHNHHECIKARTKAMDMDYFLKSVGLNTDVPMQQLSAKRAFLSSSNKPENETEHLEVEEMTEYLFEDQVLPQCKKLELPGYSSPACRSPKSPKSPYMNWDDKDFSDLMVIKTPKLV